MPNWCFNRVTVFGEPEEIAAFRTFVEGPTSKFDFDKIKPVPRELDAAREDRVLPDGTVIGVCKPSGFIGEQDLVDRFGAANPIEWVSRNWGTTKIAFDVEVDDDEIMVEYRFNTAWGPPSGIYLQLVEQFPQLGFSWFYDEPGNELAGYLNPDQAKRDIDAYGGCFRHIHPRDAEPVPHTTAPDTCAARGEPTMTSIEQNDTVSSSGWNAATRPSRYRVTLTLMGGTRVETKVFEAIDEDAALDLAAKGGPGRWEILDEDWKDSDMEVTEAE